MNKKISIIVPMYNTSEYLSRCLESLIHQTYKNIEIICVNDGSTDDTLEKLKEYAKQDERIVIINSKNEGVSLSRNKGLNKATGEYITFIDSDDWVELDTCEIALKNAIEYNADVVFWNYIKEFQNKSVPLLIMGEEKIVYKTSSETKQLQRRFLGLYGTELARPEHADSLSTVWGKLYKAEIIKKNDLKFVDLSTIGVCEDGLFNLNCFEFVNCAVYLPNCFNHYRKTNSGSLTKRYRKMLPQQCNNLHKLMNEYIELKNCDGDFKEALNNRISMSIIGLGLNTLNADKDFNKLKEIKRIISSVQYRSAVKNLSLKYFPVHWRFFFFFAKYKMPICLYIMLFCIKKLR